MIKKRLKIFRKKIFKEDKKVEGFLITNLKNIYYLSDFNGEGTALITNDKNYLFTDSRFTEQAQKESPDYKVITDEPSKKNARILALKKIIEKKKIKKISFESSSLNYANFKKYSENFNMVEFLPTEDLIEQMRMVKNKGEIIKMKKAAQIATESLKELFGKIKPGIREIDIAAELAYIIRKNGAQKEAFDTIVGSGKRSFLPHVKPSEKKINVGEFIIIDMGANYQNYHSDMTRTIVLGKKKEKQKEIFSIVLEAQQKVLDFLKPGIECKGIDFVARDIIKKRGYGKYFRHNLGHGVGLDIHELPYISFKDDTVLSPGMVITIEPGIYLPEIGGVRIEDTVLITEDGYEILTLFPKNLNF